MGKAQTEYLGEILIEDIIIENRAREDKGELEVLASSIDDIGLIHPILVDKKMRLLAGERRIRATELLGRKKIRAEMRTGGDELQVEFDENVHRKPFTWVEQAQLQKLIYDKKKKVNPSWSLRDQGDLRKSSHETVRRDILLAEFIELAPDIAEEFETQDQAWKYYEKLEEQAYIKAAQANRPEHVVKAPKWAHEHFMVGDCLDGMKSTGADTADFAEVDPPYAIEIDRRKGGRNKSDGYIEDYSEIDSKAYPALMQEVCREVYRILKPNAFAIFWYGLQWHCQTIQWLTNAGFKVGSIPAIWYKGAMGQTAQPDIMLGSSYEPFFVVRKGQPRMARQGRSNVFHYSPLSPAKKTHSTEKPIELMSEIFSTILFPGSNIMIPFLGSGVSLRAAYKNGHTGFGWDKSDKHRERFLERVAGEFVDDDSV